ncbi:hypothetical protein DC366_03910 [Pelagivirga sediminicola]|uniref:LicD/FKTN/FKRP nucleotidyltransferase domain-containing protein n=1 Tax=Pelagivirga sediminicola TaxID=2170575 RepID=A0A2T7G940_9RHOB|nr:LicD family protein [Pelagivirga sediminicola]PVA10940.1 hypothetical protein DC366_03910 [Pelagivirga sediminicola]
MQTSLTDPIGGLRRIEQIHALAEAELKGQAPDFDAPALLAELDDLAQKPRTVTELEARIMVQYIGRLRPARARILMNSLREERTKEGDPDAFVQFEAMIKTALGRGAVIGHDFQPDAFQDRDHQAIWDDVRNVVRSLERWSTNIFLNSGTLLGVVRDRKLIDHDDDVDLGMLIEARTEREAGRIWAQICGEMDAAGLLADYDPAAMAQVKLNTSTGLALDLFPAWTFRGQVYVFPHTYGELSEDDVLPLQPCELSGMQLPARPERMLAVNYGDGWREPDPYFVFPWKRRKRQFRKFQRACGVEE